MFRYGLTILLSAFLLFMVQPMLARQLLPKFGGTASIWTTCIMFFQVALFVGYLYAHSSRWLLTPIRSWLVHSVFVAAAVIWLFLQPSNSSLDSGAGLSWQVSVRLLVIAGLPFVVLAATGPLVQAWHSVSHPLQQTYRLYALSNLGSMFALVAYPLLFDPLAGIQFQQQFWSVAFVVFAIAIVSSGAQVARASNWKPNHGSDSESAVKRQQGRSWRTACVWAALSGIGSALLVATSNILCQEIAAFPLLWLLPMICYLATMIICFDWPGAYQRWLFWPAYAASCFLAIIIYHFGTNIGFVWQSAGCCLAIFSGCMICHGELVRLKPPVEHLTDFYLAIALGGAVGGVFAVVAAPRIFPQYFEFHVSLLATLLVSTILFSFEYSRQQASQRNWYLLLFVNGLAAVPVVCSIYYFLDPTLNHGVVFQGRNDYGLVSVKETSNYRIMKSGSTNHGGQFIDSEQALQPFAYYSAGSGAERAFRVARKSEDGSQRPLKVGVIGLGTGSLLTYQQPGDQFRFYEINPMVEFVAREYFDYLPADDVKVVIGDGRVELQREWEQDGSHEFDLLFLDAFSSDSIPVHLLTAECFDLYLKHLDRSGVIIAHITNKFVDLKPVIAHIAHARQLDSVRIEHRNDEFSMVTDWVLLSRHLTSGDERFREPDFGTNPLNWAEGLDELAWTDDNSSVLPVIVWQRSERE